MLFSRSFFQSDLFKQFSPTEKKGLLKAYRHELGLGTNVTFSSSAFDELFKNRIRGYHGFTKTKAPDNKEFQKALSESTSPVSKEVQKAIDEALGASEEFKDAKKKYSANIAAFQELMKEVPTNYKVDALRGLMVELQGDAKKAIENQHKKEVASLTERFEDTTFCTSLKTSLNLNDDDFGQIKDDLFEELASSHKKQLDDFTKSTQQSLKNLHDAARKEVENLLFIANLHWQNDTDMRIEIERVREKNRQHLGLVENKPTSIEVNLKKDTAEISGVGVEQLAFIKTLTGKKINVMNNEKTGETVFSLQMGMGLTNPGYLFHNKQSAKTELMTLAQAVRASGCDTITMTLEFGNNEIAEERARMAYVACIESGFEPKNIKININGKLYTPKEIQSELYGRQRALEYQSIQTTSAQIRAELDQLKTFEPVPTGNQDRLAIKNRLEAIKSKAASPEEEATATPTPPEATTRP